MNLVHARADSESRIPTQVWKKVSKSPWRFNNETMANSAEIIGLQTREGCELSKKFNESAELK